MKDYPNEEEGENFIFRKKFRFIPNFTRPIKTFIELEVYPSNICCLSFYERKNGIGKNKYRVRSKLGSGHTRSIFKACLDAFLSLDGYHALIFVASNDLNELKELNPRYSAYQLFLERFLPDYENYLQKGSIKLNTLMLYHQNYRFKDQADQFYLEFEKKIETEMTSGEPDKI
ncbi:MAG: hypothetical protein KDD12_20585 [Lewinella sp.]|nr:hypothetical protein [Lewinella sp.]